MSSPSPPPSPSGRTSAGNFLRSNFSSSPGRDRPPQVFALQDEGKGTPAWMKKLLAQKKAEYRARWGELPDDDEQQQHKVTAEPERNESVAAPATATADDEDGETIEEVIYEEEYEEEVVEDEYTEEEIVTTDDEYTYEEVTSDEDDPMHATAKPLPTRKGKRPTAEQMTPSSKPPTAMRTTPTPMKSRDMESTPVTSNRPPTRPAPQMVLQRPPPTAHSQAPASMPPPPHQKAASMPTNTRSTSPPQPQRNSFSLARMMADEVAAAPTPQRDTSPPPRTSNSTMASSVSPARPTAETPATVTPAANEAALRAQLAALEAQLADARRRQAAASPSPSPPRQRPNTSPPRTAPSTKTLSETTAAAAPRAASPPPPRNVARQQQSQPAPPSPTTIKEPVTTRSASPPPPQRTQASTPRELSPPRAQSPPPPSPPSPPQGTSPKNAASPKRVQFSQPAPVAAQPQVVPTNTNDEDSMYDYVIEIDTVSSAAGASTSVYEIEYEDGSTIASRPDPRNRPPTIQENDEEMPGQERDGKGGGKDLKPKSRSRNQVWALWLGCCAIVLLLLLGGLVAGAFLAEDEMDFLPFIGDDSDSSESDTKGLESNITTSPMTIEPLKTIAPTVAPVTNPTPGNEPNTTPSPPTPPPTTDTAVSTLMPSLTSATQRPTLSQTNAPQLTVSPTSWNFLTPSPTTTPAQTTTPTVLPTSTPTLLPTTLRPTASPTVELSYRPTTEPTTESVATPEPTIWFIDTTTKRPTERATERPTFSLTSSPTFAPGTSSPTFPPTGAPFTNTPTRMPTNPPTTPQVQPTPPSGVNIVWGLTSGPFTNAESSGFGEAMAMDGNILVVGAPRLGSGAVETYSRSSSTGAWSPINTVSPDEASDFGASISVSVGESRVAMAVGAPTTQDDQGFQLPFGAAFYYELTSSGTESEWIQRGSRVAPNPTVFSANGEAGAAVAVSAESRRMAVGAPSVTLDPDNIDNGQVFVYEFDGTALNLMSTAGGLEPYGRFGSAIAITPDGNRLLVGAPGSVGSSAGAIYYFEWDSVDSWQIILPLPGASETENLGTSVAILDNVGDVIAMGGPNFDGGRGVIRVYRRQGGTFWGQLGGDIVGEPGESLGTTLAAGPNSRVVAGVSDSFRAFEYDAQQNDWIRVGIGEPTLGSEVASVGSSNNGDIAVGTADGRVSVYGL